MDQIHNRNGGLTIVPMPNHIGQAKEIKQVIEGSTSERRHRTEVDIAIYETGVDAS